MALSSKRAALVLFIFIALCILFSILKSLLQFFPQEPGGVALITLRHFLGSAAAEELSPTLSPFGSHVDEVVGHLDDIEVVLNDDDRISLLHKAVEHAQEHPDVVEAFLQEYAQSVRTANTDLDRTAALCEQQGVVAKAAIAKKALPACNIVCRTGDEMQKDVSAYLSVLCAADPAAVGGKLPDEGFYWKK